MSNRIRSSVLVLIAVVASHAVTVSTARAEPSLTEVAQLYFRGIYGCNAEVVDKFASEDVVVSYPVFQKLFGKPAVRGRDAVRAFAERFCKKWTDAEFQFHDAIADRSRVVLVWSFSATLADHETTAPRSSWGGISLFRFNGEGRITHELGEESEPGPIARLNQSGSE